MNNGKPWWHALPFPPERDQFGRPFDPRLVRDARRLIMLVAAGRRLRTRLWALWIAARYPDREVQRLIRTPWPGFDQIPRRGGHDE